MNKMNNSNIINKSNILPKIFNIKNEENSTFDINNNVEVGIETSIGGHNGEDNIHKDNKENFEQKPHIVKIVKKNKMSTMDYSITPTTKDLVLIIKNKYIYYKLIFFYNDILFGL